jgi:signal transduction histidine kinase
MTCGPPVNGLSIDFFSAGMDDLRLDFDTEINLYRLIQEGLNNIKKHADASRVIIRLVASSPNIILRIEDDGKGFDVEGRLPRASKEKRMGLASMEERGSLLNGNLRIQSRLMEGTKILVEIPYGEKKNGSKEKHIDH